MASPLVDSEARAGPPDIKKPLSGGYLLRVFAFDYSSHGWQPSATQNVVCATWSHKHLAIKNRSLAAVVFE